MQRLAVTLALVAVAFAGCVDEPESSRVEFKTTLGDFVVEVWADKAPKTAENFLQYVADGHYDGLTFHRVAPNFVVQGGGYLPDYETLRETRPPIVNEASVDVPNDEWTLSMARTNAPDSATSQFFINLKDNAALDKKAGSAGYAVFGEVISGFDTIEAMTKVEAGESFGAGGFFPKEPIVIISARIISGDEPPAPPEPTPADITANTITAGTYTISGDDDSILVWAQNRGEQGATVQWNLTNLPDGWTVFFSADNISLGGVGSATEAGYALMTVYPGDAPAGTYNATLETGFSSTPIEMTIAPSNARISQAGDTVEVSYAGSCSSNGEQFDAGNFPLTLGEGRAIPGFDLGIIGLAEGESATLNIPGVLGYGTTDTRTGCAGGNLDFEITLTSFS